MKKGLLSLVLLLIMAAVLFAAGGQEAAPVPEKNRVVVALGSTTGETLRFWTAFNWEMLDASLQSLVGNDPETGEFVPTSLAESWSHNDSMTEWTFKLREGVQFHHGWGEVTAKDVVHSYELHVGPGSVIPNIEQLRAKKVEILDRYTVRFTYEQPNPNYLFLHGGRTLLFIYSKAQFDAEGLDGYDRQLVGTGQYEFVERSPGRILFKRVDNHYSGIVPDFEELEIRYVPEPGQRLAMLRTGDVDIAQLPPELHNEAEKANLLLIPSKQATTHTAIAFNGLYFRENDPAFRGDLPWADVRIRRAINHAINRDELNQLLYNGRAKTLPLFSMKLGHEGYDPTIADRFEEMYGYNPEKAKALMKEAGYPEAFKNPTITLVTTNFPGQPEFALQTEYIEQALRAVGFKTEIREIDHATVGSIGRSRQSYHMNPIRNAPVRPSETAFRTYNAGTSSYGGWEDDTIYSYLQELIRTTNVQERERIAKAAFNHLFEVYAQVPLFETFAYAVVNPKTIADWTFPGVTSSGVGQWHLIQAAK
ncbi:MAG: ABC transporter substrate-binding protein [Sphaerochaetaceae bacterium]|nr:ABC transporter substrate-binding protein [Sphaerochaetaceae bacterium]